jgi:hypothetical protein
LNEKIESVIQEKDQDIESLQRRLEEIKNNQAQQQLQEATNRIKGITSDLIQLSKIATPSKSVAREQETQEHIDSEAATNLEQKLQEKDEELSETMVKYNSLIQQNRNLTKKISLLESKLAAAVRRIDSMKSNSSSTESATTPAVATAAQPSSVGPTPQPPVTHSYSQPKTPLKSSSMSSFTTTATTTPGRSASTIQATTPSNKVVVSATTTPSAVQQPKRIVDQMKAGSVMPSVSPIPKKVRSVSESASTTTQLDPRTPSRAEAPVPLSGQLPQSQAKPSSLTSENTNAMRDKTNTLVNPLMKSSSSIFSKPPASTTTTTAAVAPRTLPVKKVVAKPTSSGTGQTDENSENCAVQ